MSWDVREASPGEAPVIVNLAKAHDEFLMPYVLNEFVVGNYVDQFIVAEKVVYQPSPHFEVGGAVHYIDLSRASKGLEGAEPQLDKILCFLLYIKQVPMDMAYQFVKSGNVAFLCQIVCPGKGSFYSILEELKARYDELWCWMSINGPSYESYKRYGFNFPEDGGSYQREFWNVYKCNYSTFALGKWFKEEKGV